jgi:hypothetical protein
VAIYRRVWDREIPIAGMNVCLADPAGRDPDKHLAVPRPHKLDPLNLERAAPFINNGCGDLNS